MKTLRNRCGTRPSALSRWTCGPRATTKNSPIPQISPWGRPSGLPPGFRPARSFASARSFTSEPVAPAILSPVLVPNRVFDRANSTVPTKMPWPGVVVGAKHAFLRSSRRSDLVTFLERAIRLRPQITQPGPFHHPSEGGLPYSGLILHCVDQRVEREFRPVSVKFRARHASTFCMNSHPLHFAASRHGAVRSVSRTQRPRFPSSACRLPA